MPDNHDHSSRSQFDVLNSKLEQTIFMLRLLLTLEGLELNELNDIEEAVKSRDDSRIQALTEKLKASSAALKVATDANQPKL